MSDPVENKAGDSRRDEAATVYLRELEVETAILRRLLRQIATDTRRSGRSGASYSDRGGSAGHQHSDVVSTAFRRLAPDLSRVAARMDVSQFLTDSMLVDPSLLSEATSDLRRQRAASMEGRGLKPVPLVELFAHVSASVDDVLDALIETWHASSLEKHIETFGSVDQWGSTSSDDVPETRVIAPARPSILSVDGDNSTTAPMTSATTAASSSSEGRKSIESKATVPEAFVGLVDAPRQSRRNSDSGVHSVTKLDPAASAWKTFNPAVRWMKLPADMHESSVHEHILTAFAMPTDNCFHVLGSPCMSKDAESRTKVVQELHTRMQNVSHLSTNHFFVCTEDELYDKAQTHGKAEQTIGVLRAFRALCDGTPSQSPTLYGCVRTTWESISRASLRLAAEKYGVSHPALHALFGDCPEAEGVAVCLPHSYVCISRYPFVVEHFEALAKLQGSRQAAVMQHLRKAAEDYARCLKESVALGSGITPAGATTSDYAEIRSRLQFRDRNVLKLYKIRNDIRLCTRLAESKGQLLTFVEFKRLERRQDALEQQYSAGWSQLRNDQQQLSLACRRLWTACFAALHHEEDVLLDVASMVAVYPPAPGDLLDVKQSSAPTQPLITVQRPKDAWRFLGANFQANVMNTVVYDAARHGSFGKWRDILSVRNFVEDISPFSFKAALPSLLDCARLGVDLSHPEAVSQLGTWSVPTLFQHCTLDQVVDIFAAALIEQNVIFIHPDLGIASRCALAVAILLSPLVWQNNLRPTPPRVMMQALQATGVENLAQANLLGVVGLASIQPSEHPVDAAVIDVVAKKVIRYGDGADVILPSRPELLFHITREFDAVRGLPAEKQAAQLQNVLSGYVKWLLATVYASALPIDQSHASASFGPLNDGTVVPLTRLAMDEDMPGGDLRSDPFWNRFSNTQMVRQHHQLRTSRAMVNALDNTVPAFLSDTTKLITQVMQGSPSTSRGAADDEGVAASPSLRIDLDGMAGRHRPAMDGFSMEPTAQST